jgi:hypothetical protein
MSYRFTIRELILLTVIVALALGWWLDRRALIVESTARRERIYDLTVELKKRYPSPYEMSPPWRDPREALTQSLDQTGSDTVKPSQ